VDKIDSTCPEYLLKNAHECWDTALESGKRNGYRNAQVTVLAPTGTIGFLMDCDTTGIEPDIALVKYKLLAGGGTLKIVNQTVPAALKTLGYMPDEISKIVAHISKHDTIEDVEVDGHTEMSGLKPEHLTVFDCAFKPAKGSRSLHYMAHIKMMAAAQPFISGAISKTINMPNSATIDEIFNAYVEAWKLGLKAVAIYRDGSKRSAPLNTSKQDEKDGKKEEKAEQPFIAIQVTAPLPPPEPIPARRRMSDTRWSLTHKFDIAGHEGYLTVGLFDDKQPGELFIVMAKEGSTIGGLMDTIGTLVSLALQYGVPIEAMVKKFAHARFEPSGFTKNEDIGHAKSIVDYIFRWLGIQFIPGYRESNNPNRHQPELPMPDLPAGYEHPPTFVAINGAATLPSLNKGLISSLQSGKDHPLSVVFRDGMVCPECGSSKIKHTGTCATCLNCGSSLGCS